MTFCNNLLDYGVIVRNLISFGLHNCTRVTLGTKEENKTFKEACLKVMEGITA